MPSTYAHYRMGKEVSEALEGEAWHSISMYRQLYLIGLHGPDILFYYKPLKSNPVNRIGFGMHERPGMEFFRYAVKVIEKKKNKEPYLAYMYGVMCHFALDVSCHGYIDKKIAESGVTHAEIEVEFDRMLMEKDGLDPLRHSLTDHIVPSMRNAGVISCFYDGTTPEQVQAALKGMIYNNKLLLAPSRIKRLFVKGILKVSGNYKEMHGLMVNYKPNLLCADSNEKLMYLYNAAEKLAVKLINEYLELDGWNPVYMYTFGSKLVDENVNDETGGNKTTDNSAGMKIMPQYHDVKDGMPA